MSDRPPDRSALQKFQGDPEVRRADALFLGFAFATLLVISGYRDGWQSFHHDIPRDKLKIDVENAASTASTLGLVAEQYRSGRLTANYVHTVGEDTREDLDEEWSHTLERSASSAEAVFTSYRATLAPFDSTSGAFAQPTFVPGAADSVLPRVAAVDSTLRSLVRRL